MTSGVRDAMQRFYSSKKAQELPKLKKKKRPKGELSEEQIQNRVVTALRKLKCFVFHIPMGGKRDAIAASRLKRSGAVRGTPDLCILNSPCEGFKGVFWELKGDKGKVSDEQVLFLNRSAELGFLSVAVSGLSANLKLVEVLYGTNRTKEEILHGIEETDGVRLFTGISRREGDDSQAV
jgi:hypothetical protein|tara:strand:+ start:417 stop:953 length:537 start_codon:yes stop_codon:yes gene_type:complete